MAAVKASASAVGQSVVRAFAAAASERVAARTTGISPSWPRHVLQAEVSATTATCPITVMANGRSSGSTSRSDTANTSTADPTYQIADESTVVAMRRRFVGLAGVLVRPRVYDFAADPG